MPPATLPPPDRRTTDAECRVTAYLAAWPLLTDAEARRELGLIDAAADVVMPADRPRVAFVTGVRVVGRSDR